MNNLEKKKHLVVSFLKFLEETHLEIPFTDENSESLEVASQCLQTAFGINYETDSKDKYPVTSGQLFNLFTSAISTPDITILKKSMEPVSDENKLLAVEFKNEGNNLMKSEKFLEAIELYTKAIGKDPTNPVYFSNRAAAYSKLSYNDKAIEDCNAAINIDPTYSKAFGRKGLAHTALNQHRLAIECYKMALRLDVDNETYQNNLTLAEQQLREAAPQGNDMDAMSQMFGGIDMSAMMNNPAIMNMASSIMANPQMQDMMANLMQNGIPGMNAGQVPPSNPDVANAAPNIPNMPNMTPANGQPNIEGLLEVGQQLARSMQEANPEFVAQLRNQMGNNPNTPDANNSNNSPSNKETE